jgi:hypothetical protein
MSLPAQSVALREATTKFTYYVAGVSLAVLAFALQTYAAPSPEWLKWLHVASWVCFLASFLACILRLEANLSLLVAEANFESRREAMDAIDQEIQTGHPMMDKTTGQLLSQAQKAKMAGSINRGRENYDLIAKAIVKKIESRYNFALGGLVAGLGLQAVAKVVSVMLVSGAPLPRAGL